MGKILERQGYHLLGYLLLGSILYWAVLQNPESHGRALSLSTSGLAALSWILAGIFQFGSAIIWRLELHRGYVHRTMGGTGFPLFRFFFAVIIITRMLLVIPISKTSAGTLPIPPALFWILILAPLPLIIWACVSVLLYFGFIRATGADHFDPAYKKRGLETRGIFKYIRNPMYAVILLLLYHPGLYFQSFLGLVAAACHHAFVWCHYFCTEKPDMKKIYGDKF
ncbi:MAG: hypothetical protein HYT79_08715 [Elusimicrobia bacterium]|nr:hypothetical protein [Elusimicrobiota bacterium]